MDKYIFFFSTINHIGLKTIIKLINFFGSLEVAFDASLLDFKKFGLSNYIIEDIFNKKKTFNFDYEISRYDKLNINIVSYFDDNYPKILKNMPDQPAIIFYKGYLNLNTTKTIGVVGSRNCSEYGVSVARDFCTYFINNNIIPVSGGAVGIDSISHEIAVNNNFPTISVMGAGLDIIYPYKNKDLFQNIVDNNGAIVSEFPLGMQALPQNFIMRNRIIAGLSSGVLIVEAGLKSGTMTTAEFAVNQNKNVFVVPGSIYSAFSEGANYLIKNGAIFATNPQEIEEMIWGIDKKLKTKNQKLKTEENKIDISWMNNDEKNIFDLILYKPKNIENIIVESSLDVKKINSILIFFEIKGLIKNIGGMNYIRNN